MSCGVYMNCPNAKPKFFWVSGSFTNGRRSTTFCRQPVWPQSDKSPETHENLKPLV
ncbi:MAG: hypothetical protein WDM96_10785 [Lacunisphaera sp.]